MIDVADNDDTVDADPTLRQWTEEQIEILEKIFEADDAREELLTAVVKESVARISLSNNEELN
jgi:nicotinamide mononucleotide adenylyltransferase